MSSFNSNVYGEYIDKESKIVLYIDAMKTTVNQNDELQNLFLSVLIHELFHLFHASFLKQIHNNNDYWYEKSTKHEIIIESLAAGFQFYFTNKFLNDKNLAKELLNEWNKHSIFVYPYSGAKVLIENPIQISSINNWIKFLENIELNDTVDELTNELEFVKLNIQQLTDYFYLSLVSLEKAESKLLITYLNNIDNVEFDNQKIFTKENVERLLHVHKYEIEENELDNLFDDAYFTGGLEFVKYFVKLFWISHLNY